MKAFLFALALVATQAAHAADEPSKIPPVKVEQAEKAIAAGVQILDVRTREEWDQGRLKDAKLATVTEDGFLDKAKALLDPKKPVLVYCRSGRRSALAAEQLRAAGFTPVHDLAGGIVAWEKAGKPVVK
jgi:rhodanese-related sulfurtransferase